MCTGGEHPVCSPSPTHTRSHTCIPQASQQPWAPASPLQRSKLAAIPENSTAPCPPRKVHWGRLHWGLPPAPISPVQSWCHQSQSAPLLGPAQKILHRLPFNENKNRKTRKQKHLLHLHALWPLPLTSQLPDRPVSFLLHSHLFVLPWTPRAMGEGGLTIPLRPPENTATPLLASQLHPAPTQPCCTEWLRDWAPRPE